VHARAAPAAAHRAAEAARRVHVPRPTSSPAFLRGPRGPQIRAAAAAQMDNPRVPALPRVGVPLVRPNSSPAFLRGGAARQLPQRPTANPRAVYAHDVWGPSPMTREVRMVHRNPITHLQRIHYQGQSHLRYQPNPTQRSHQHAHAQYARQRVSPRAA